MGVRRISMRWILLLLMPILMAPGVLAQEGGVCLVYFTSYACGDECRYTDTFMDGLVNEYSEELTAIRYFVDAGEENSGIFQAYQERYGLPSTVPVVLFGENKYFSGMQSIFSNCENTVYDLITKNGSNCPLESGYVPPSSISPGGLPGQAEIFQPERPTEDGGDGFDGSEGGNDNGGAPESPAGDFASVFKEVVESEEFPLWVMVAAVFILIIVLVALFMGREPQG